MVLEIRGSESNEILFIASLPDIHPNGKRSEYLAELANVASEILDESVDELTEKMKPSPNTSSG